VPQVVRPESRLIDQVAGRLPPRIPAPVPRVEAEPLGRGEEGVARVPRPVALDDGDQLGQQRHHPRDPAAALRPWQSDPPALLVEHPPTSDGEEQPAVKSLPEGRPRRSFMLMSDRGSRRYGEWAHQSGGVSVQAAGHHPAPNHRGHCADPVVSTVRQRPPAAARASAWSRPDARLPWVAPPLERRADFQTPRA